MGWRWHRIRVRGRRPAAGTMLLAAGAVLLAAAGPLRAGQAPGAGDASQRELSTQGVVTLLARRHPWIWQLPPGALQIHETRTSGSGARLVWVSGRPPGEGGEVRHAFALLARSRDGRRDVLVDLSSAVDAGSEVALAAVQLAAGEAGFVIGVRASPGRPRAGLYVVAPPDGGERASEAILLHVTGDLVTVEQDPAGRLRVRVGRLEAAPAEGGVLEFAAAADQLPGGRPVRAVAVTSYTYQPGRRAFEVASRAPELTAFGLAEAFLEALRRGDMARALSLTSAEWRRVMGVTTPEQLRAYLRASRPGLLARNPRLRYLGGSVGEEAASILFSDAAGRIYRIRLRASPRRPDQMLVLPGQEVRWLAGVWEVDGLDGGG